MNETVQMRWRLPKKLVREAEPIFRELGVSPGAAVAIFFAQVVQQRAIPFTPSLADEKKAEAEDQNTRPRAVAPVSRA